MRTDRLRLLDAIERIELISSFSERGREAFSLHVWAIVAERIQTRGVQFNIVVASLPGCQLGVSRPRREMVG